MISFGPIPSRRLGKSLGINNILSPKVCSYECIYCQVGKTSRKRINRESFFQPEVIYKNVAQHIEQLKGKNTPDYLTFVSNGEPTLDINLGKSIQILRKLGFPIAVITNGSLLFHESVRDDLHTADWVSLKMDAADDKTWQNVNNPPPELNFDKHIENQILFANNYRGELRTETMLVKDVNDTLENLNGLAEILKKINPGKAYLAIPTRPPAYSRVTAPETDKMNIAWQIYNDKNINTEFLTSFEGTDTGFTGNIYEDILNITSVHPLREDTLEELLGKNNADFQVVESLMKQQLIKSTIFNGKKFYIRQFHLSI
jgi:wyosine [tRNA(Phe)-imidazoG37] synthetase (radical SAM superfamily)